MLTTVAATQGLNQAPLSHARPQGTSDFAWLKFCGEIIFIIFQAFLL